MGVIDTSGTFVRDDVSDAENEVWNAGFTAYTNAGQLKSSD
jgi:hypothetical protein